MLYTCVCLARLVVCFGSIVWVTRSAARATNTKTREGRLQLLQHHRVGFGGRGASGLVGSSVQSFRRVPPDGWRNRDSDSAATITDDVA